MHAATDPHSRRPITITAAATTLVALAAAGWLWSRTHDDSVRRGTEVQMTDVSRRTCVPVADTQEVVYGDSLANVSSEPVEVVDVTFDSTGGAALEKAWLAEPGNAVGVLSHWPPPEMAEAFTDGGVVPFPTTLRPNPSRTSSNAQTLVLYLRMPPNSSIANVAVTYRKPNSKTLYRSASATSTLTATAAKSCSTDSDATP